MALYLSILGNKVDILTSSQVLTERDVKNRKKLFNRFEIFVIIVGMIRIKIYKICLNVIRLILYMEMVIV